MARYKIGIDVGGTFTDFLLMEAGGATGIYKVLSTPDDPSRAVLEGLKRMATAHNTALQAFLAEVEIIVHGTTVTTNAVLTGRIAKTGLVTTKGFRDALQMRRGIREETYDNKAKPPEPLVPRWLRRPVSERVMADGTVRAPLDAGDVEDAATHFREAGVEAVAICFMHAYANPDHEAAAAALIKTALPDVYCSASSDVLPQVRFYDRVSTTVLNAAVGPILDRYLTSLTARLDAAGFAGVLLIMQSNGGVTTPGVAARLAASTLLSGPAAAPVAGLAYSEPHGERSFITVDMGGTSFDAALVRDGAPELTTDARIAKHALALPSLEINTIGAGGGSIGWIDDGGLLRMGPASAGADPGPACYGRGGMLPTCSDANLVLGYLSAEFFAGGHMTLDRDAAAAAIEREIAQPLGLSLAEAAFGMFRVMNVNMASGIREITVQKGFDPRDFPLICAGGAGPIHAAMIAEELEIGQILVPRESSIFCAAGMLRSDLKHDYVRSYHTPFSGEGLNADRFQTAFRWMSDEANETLAGEGIAPKARRFAYALDLRYLGQYHEVRVDVPEAELDGPDIDAIAGRLHRTHNRLYGYDLEADGTSIELVNLRLSATGITEKPPIAREARVDAAAECARKGTRAVFLPHEGDFRDVAVYDGDKLRHGHRIEGPSIVEQVNTTVLLPGGYGLSCDELGSFVMEKSG